MERTSADPFVASQPMKVVSLLLCLQNICDVCCTNAAINKKLLEIE